MDMDRGTDSNESIYSVTDLNVRVKGLLDSDPGLMGICVRGELSNYKMYPSGHHYFTLKDASSSIRCVMFKGSASKLRFRPESGMGVLAYGSVSVYPRDGAYQLYCTGLSPEGMGDLHVAFEQLKDKLSKEGLFDREKKKPIPRIPKKIAVITSSAGAAVRDVIRILGERWPMAEVIILPVRVQGVEAPPEIAGAIRYANRHKVADVIITGRGGGSMEDLWAFNDERVARAIFDSVIPVISAVGHEPDVTISDYAADLRAATPSNGAELAVPDVNEIREVLLGYEMRAGQAAGKKLSDIRGRLADLASRRVMESPTGYIDTRRMELDFIQNRFAASGMKYVSGRRQAFVKYAAALDALSPLKVLKRGYAAASLEDGVIVKSVKQIEVGDELELRLSDGRAKCHVNDIDAPIEIISTKG